MSGRMQEKVEYALSEKEIREKDVLNDYFDEIEECLRYQHWFCGHYHEYLRMDEKHTVLYKDIIMLQSSED